MFALCLVICQGCVGVMILRTKTETFQPPKISNFWPDVHCLSQQESVATNTIHYTGTWLQTNWGNPASITFQPSSRDETWTYDRGLVWNGCVLYVGMPIPLILPTARAKIELVLKDGQVIRARVVRNTDWHAVTGFGAHNGPCRPTWSYDCGNGP